MIHTLRPYLLTVALGGVVYGQSILFGFNHFDDHKYIVENHATISGLSRIPFAFQHGIGDFYRPVLLVTWMLDAELGGTAPWIYHVSNVVLHLIASCLVLLTFRTLRFSNALALSFALLFACHPLLAEAVVWIPGRNDALLTIFVLTAFLTLLRVADRNTIVSFILHFLAFALAVFTKEPAILFPFAAMFYLFVVSRERVLTSRTFVLVLGWTAIGLTWFLLRQSALAGSASGDELSLRAFLKNLPTLPTLLGKFILPWKLSGVATFDAVSIVAGTVFAMLLAIVLVTTRGLDVRLVSFGAIWFLLFLLPTFVVRMSIADDHFDYMEHRVYLPMIGLMIILMEGLRRKGIQFSGRPAQIGITCLLLVLSARNVVYSRSYRDALPFWEQAIRDNPARSNFHSVLAHLHYGRKDLERAAALFERAASLSVTNDPSNYRNLGVVYGDLKRHDDVIPMFEKALAIDADRADVHYGLGRTYHARQQFDRALEHAVEAVRLEPTQSNYAFALAVIYADMGRVDESVATCRKMLRVNPNDVRARNLLDELEDVHPGQRRP